MPHCTRKLGSLTSYSIYGNNRVYMRKNIAIIAVYFALTPFLLFFLIIYFLYLSHSQTGADGHMMALYNKTASFQALPDEKIFDVQTSLIPLDARSELLKQFLARYHSPLVPYSQLLVDVADKYQIDYRLLPAIAMQESNLCKKVPKRSEYNCWGFGVYGSKRTGFSNYPEAINAVAKTLSQDYVQKGLTEPSEIMTKYTPGSNGSWANSVSYFMDKIHESI